MDRRIKSAAKAAQQTTASAVDTDKMSDRRGRRRGSRTDVGEEVKTDGKSIIHGESGTDRMKQVIQKED